MSVGRLKLVIGAILLLHGFTLETRHNNYKCSSSCSNICNNNNNNTSRGKRSSSNNNSNNNSSNNNNNRGKRSSSKNSCTTPLTTTLTLSSGLRFIQSILGNCSWMYGWFLQPLSPFLPAAEATCMTIQGRREEHGGSSR